MKLSHNISWTVEKRFLIGILIQICVMARTTAEAYRHSWTKRYLTPGLEGI